MRQEYLTAKLLVIGGMIEQPHWQRKRFKL
jgi:hypothetical protein